MARTVRGSAICVSAVSLTILACAGRAASEHHPSEEAPATSRTAGQGDSLLGRWRLAADPPPQGRLGTQLTLVIDSLAGDSVFGRLTMMFSGDVGINPSWFGGLTGRSSGDSVALLVPSADPGGASLRLTGTLARDTIFLTSFEIGDDQMLGEAARLLLLREP